MMSCFGGHSAISLVRVMFAIAVGAILTRPSFSQGAQTESDAIDRAARLLHQIGRDWSPANAKAQRLNQSWQVDDRAGGIIAMVDTETGACSALVDLALSDEVYRRKGMRERVVAGRAEAWATGETVLRHAGQWDTNWERFELRPLGDQPGAERAKDAHSDRYTLEWLKKAEGYEGAYGRATMTLDLVTGRPVGFTVNVSDFELPSRIMPRSDALSAVRRHWSAEKGRVIDSGYGGKADEWFGWPSDQDALSRLVLQVRQDGTACFGSDYGQRMSDQGKARLCWVFGYNGTELAVDAENGEPFAGGISKAAQEAARDNPPRNPYAPPPTGVTASPLYDLWLPVACASLAAFAIAWWLRGRVGRK